MMYLNGILLKKGNFYLINNIVYKLITIKPDTLEVIFQSLSGRTF